MLRRLEDHRLHPPRYLINFVTGMGVMVESLTSATKLGLRVPRALAAAFALVIQIIVAGVLFLAIGAVAVLLNLATNLCETHMWAPVWAISGMRSLEVFLWAVDAICTVLLIVREALDFCVTTWTKREG